MAAHRPRVRLRLVVACLAAAMLVVAGLVVLLPFAYPVAPAPSRAARAATPAEAAAALGRAATALRAGDRAAYLAALPASGAPARDAVAELYDRLAPLPWTRFSLEARAIPGRPGRFDVYAVGELARAGPPDRVAARRVLHLVRLGARVVADGDSTPPRSEREFLMWTGRPVVVRRNGLVVVAGERGRRRAEALAAAAAAARRRLALLGLRSDEPIVVSVYSSLADLRDALGGGPDERRIRFFSNAAPRLASRPWRVRDVGVLGPSLDDVGSWLPTMLAHELTHAHTARWFAGTRHAPTFLLEGLATAVEGRQDWAPLREEVATGNHLWPLADAIGADDLWRGNSTEQIRLAYLEAGSVVRFVLHRWSLARLKRFVTAVSDSDLDTQSLDVALRRSLGISWDEFYDGWKRYVLTLP